jgi:hypothetical protein
MPGRYLEQSWEESGGGGAAEGGHCVQVEGEEMFSFLVQSGFSDSPIPRTTVGSLLVPLPCGEVTPGEDCGWCLFP